MQTEQETVDSLVCPSFSAYSSNKLNDIADQVTRDVQNDNRFDENDDTDFEFVAFRKVADGVFFDAATHAFPIFDRDLAAPPAEGRISGAAEDTAAIQITLEKLMMEDAQSSSSSSEVEDELDAIPPGTYCVWTPKPVEAPASRCKKSKSTGSSSSRRWKLLDLLRRSNSEGKESFVFLTPSASSSSVGLGSGKKKGARGENSNGGGKNIPASSDGEKKVAAVSAHEALYVRNREMRRVDKRRSYLPYRQDLVGFCVNLNSMGKAFPLNF
ncbi:hypothetical protein RJT34_27764 [Clitoria ternatea]|uniref:Uncharacterized protein n=1 Tax=Clitoria ternatea TaxID=43366 RepID=A0AAN9I8N8_CLITE